MKVILNQKDKFARAIAAFALVVMVTLTWFIMFSGAVSADDAPKTSLTISPMSQKIILTPGETYEGTIKVIGSSMATGTVNYTAEVGAYTPIADNGKDSYGGADVVTKTNHTLMKDWTTLDKASGELQPNETEILTYKIQVPKDAPAGAQYISILVYNSTPKDESNKDGINIDSKFQFASIVYANVAGETVEKGAITENSMPTILTSNKLEATSMVRNNGNVYTNAEYILQVWPLFSDEEICTNEESADEVIVLPDTDRYHVQTCNLPMVGIFKAKQLVKIFGEESVLEKTIVVCPLWLMLIVVFAIVGIIVWIVIRVRMRKKAEE